MKYFQVYQGKIRGIVSLFIALLFGFSLTASAVASTDFDFIDTSGLQGGAEFIVDAWHDGEDVFVGFQIPAEHYLYRKHFSLSPDNFGPLRMAQGQSHSDEFFGDVEIYRDKVVVAASLPDSRIGTVSPVTLTAHYQGCSDLGICLPPASQTIDAQYRTIAPSDYFLEVSDVPGYAIQSEDFSGVSLATEPAPATTQPEVQSGFDRFLSVLDGDSLWQSAFVFFLAGLALTFTPCVLPMIPIMSAMIVGQSASRLRSFSLSASYVFGMAVTYTAVGILMGLFGASLNVQAYMQSPFVISAFAILFILLAMALTGAFTLQMSPGLTSRITQWQDRAQNSGPLGIALAGALSVLVVSPCVSAPLVGALAFISATGDALSGGIALLSMALGMGIPLILAGTYGTSLLPRRGPWMNAVKLVFALMMLGIAVWLLDRILPDHVALLAWAGFLIAVAMGLGLFRSQASSFWQQLCRGLSLFPLIWAIALILSAASGGSSLTQPLGHLAVASKNPVQELSSLTVYDQQELDDRIRASDKPVFVHLSADWCASCEVMEARYHEPAVASQLSRFLVIKADITETNSQSQAILSKYEAFGPPAMAIHEPGNTNANEVFHGTLEVELLASKLAKFR